MSCSVTEDNKEMKWTEWKTETWSVKLCVINISWELNDFRLWLEPKGMKEEGENSNPIKENAAQVEVKVAL